ncbi:hypothetical protein P4B35_23380 [Pontiellaceae bacterium B12227]|nr:hypothetical protein [Pontiellaceae bacterium B12227]
MYCSWCGVEIGREQWRQAVYCCHCGKTLMKGAMLGGGSSVIPSRSAGTRRVMSALGAARGTIQNHPVLSSVGSIGIGAAGIVASPFLILAGQWIVGLGVGAILLGYVAESALQDGQYKDGMKLGVRMVGAGAVVCGAGYALLGAGVVTALFGVGLGVFTGVKAYVGYRQMKQVLAAQPLLLTEGGR